MPDAEHETAVAEVGAVVDVDAIAPGVAVVPELDAALAAAVDEARAAAVEVGGESVGDHLSVLAEAERVVTHAFAASLTGYSGWYWAVTLARAPRSKTVTVSEVVLLPGADALLAPAWVPWQERLKPGDLSPGDILPADPDDPRLVPAYAVDDDSDKQVKQVGLELGLGRERVMSRDGRLDAAERWHGGDFGPRAPMAKQAPGRCGTCGFLLPLAGSLSAGFGVCGNEITDSDGRVVSVEYGCGAHSEVKVAVPSLAEPTGAIYDDGEDIEPALTPAKPAEAVEPAQSAEAAEAAEATEAPESAESAESAESDGAGDPPSDG